MSGHKIYECPEGHPNTYDPYKIYVFGGSKFMYCELCGKKIVVQK